MTRLGICLAALALAGCGWSMRSGNGNVVTRTREISGFNAVRNETSLRLNVREGTGTSVEVTIDENLQDLVRLELEGDTLVLDVDPNVGINSSPGSSVDVRLPDLRAATSTGSGRVALSEIGGGEDLDLESTGSGGLEFSGAAERLDLLCTGSGSVKLTGSAELLVVKVTGSGSVDAKALSAKTAELETTGSGSIWAHLDGGTVRLTVHGSGSIHWSGDASVLSLIDDGSGSISHD